jgi:hypothetical protein
MQTESSVLTHTLPEIRHRMYFRNAAVRRMYGNEAGLFIARFVDIGSQETEVFATSTVFNIEAINSRAIHSLVNLKRMNDIANPNEFIAAVNRKLPYNGLYVGCVETLEQRRSRILNKFWRPIGKIYYFFDFMLKRVFPKWGPTRRIYRLLTRGNNRAMSLTETLGRLSVSGFDIDEYEEVGNMTYFVVRKIARPIITVEPKYGMLIRLRRIGRNEKLFNVYKFRTMHPYAEFLQEYIHRNNRLKNGGKFNDDFRITSWGRWMRMLWLDEQPMWINWFRGEMKIVGVRPLSKQYFTLYPEDFRRRRIKYTPGLIPPYYADLPCTIQEIIASEEKYLDAYDKHPWITDLRYFSMAVYNIVLKGARSG